MRIRDLAILRSAGAGMWGNALQSANASRAAGAQKYAGPAGRKDSELMKAYAQDVERLASEQGILLDDTEESLERVDLLLHKIAGDTVLTPRTPEEASQLWALAKIYGGYLGEVVIRNMSGPGSCSTIRMAAREWFSIARGQDVPVRQSLQPTDRGSVFQRLRPLPRAAGHHEPSQPVRNKSILSCSGAGVGFLG